LATERSTQQSILDALQEDDARFRRLINHLSDEQQQEAFTPEGWSVEDFLAHMAHWKDSTLKLIVAYTHDQQLPPVMPSGDEANAQAREVAKSLSLPQVRNYWEETHKGFTHLVADELDDERLQEKVRPPWNEGPEMRICDIVTDICGHEAEHFELIEQYFEIPDNLEVAD
jgi:uncharacterized damage-inducible protein DinB